MDDMTALQRLIANRQRDLNAPSLIAMYRAANLPKGAITYETLRRMATGRQRSIRGDQTYEDLSTILRVSVDDVKSAEAGYTPIGGWERYERLNAEERKAIESVPTSVVAVAEILHCPFTRCFTSYRRRGCRVVPTFLRTICGQL